MKNISVLLVVVMLLLMGAGCAKQEVSAPTEPTVSQEPDISQMRSICELAVMECYYHNVAMLKEEDATGFWFWKKDKHFWVEYSGTVKMGIDASQVQMEVSGNQVTITIPEAKVLGCKVDSASLQEDSYIVDPKSADITAEDEVKAFEEAQRQLEENAGADRALLTSAQQRAQKLLEDYVVNVGKIVGKQYTIRWVSPDGTENPPASEPDEDATGATSGS